MSALADLATWIDNEARTADTVAEQRALEHVGAEVQRRLARATTPGDDSGRELAAARAMLSEFIDYVDARGAHGYAATWVHGAPVTISLDVLRALAIPPANETDDPEELQRRINAMHRRRAVIASGTGDGTDDEQCRAWVGSEHVYLSTGCLHGEHGYCQAMTGQQGEKRPGRCKFCDARCVCLCHGASGAAVSSGDGDQA